MSQFKVQQGIWAVIKLQSQAILWPGIIHKITPLHNSSLFEYHVQLVDKQQGKQSQLQVFQEEDIRPFQSHFFDEKEAAPSLVDAYHRAIRLYGQFRSAKNHQESLMKQQNWVQLGLEKPEQMKRFLWSLCQSQKAFILDEQMIMAIKNIQLSKKYVKQYWQQSFCKILNYLVNEREMDERTKSILDELRVKIKKLIIQVTIDQS